MQVTMHSVLERSEESPGRAAGGICSATGNKQGLTVTAAPGEPDGETLMQGSVHACRRETWGRADICTSYGLTPRIPVGSWLRGLGVTVSRRGGAG